MRAAGRRLHCDKLDEPALQRTRHEAAVPISKAHTSTSQFARAHGSIVQTLRMRA